MGGERRRRGLASAPRQPGARAPPPALLRPPSPTSLTPTLAGRDQGALVPRFEADAALAPRRDRVGVDVAGLSTEQKLHLVLSKAKESGMTVTATPSHFEIAIDLVCREGDRVVGSREWTRSVPRDWA